LILEESRKLEAQLLSYSTTDNQRALDLMKSKGLVVVPTPLPLVEQLAVRAVALAEEMGRTMPADFREQVRRLMEDIWLEKSAAQKPDPNNPVWGRDVCFELFDLKADQMVMRLNSRRCAERVTPCSTFKVPLALMALDAGVVSDENSPFEWDHVERGRPSWNRDQTVATWMKESVVWVSQRLTPLLGLERIARYLGMFQFGNKDMSGGLTTAWLSSSLTISPDEQLEFWKKLWREQFPVSRKAYDVTKKITFVENSPSGWTLHGKTGSGDVKAPGAGEGTGLSYGWFAGHVMRGDREFVFVSSYTDKQKHKDTIPPGWIARDMAKRVLADLGYY
jgi:beta-lactamase class D